MSDLRILLVEDDVIDAKAFGRAVEDATEGGSVRIAKDGVEALQVLRGADGIEPIVRPYLIVLDLNMPRMDGFELLAEIRADPALSDSVVFVLTTSRAEDDKRAAYAKHVAGYMLKCDPVLTAHDQVEMLDGFWRVVELP